MVTKAQIDTVQNFFHAQPSYSHIESVSSPSSGVHMPRQVRPVRVMYLFRTSSNPDALIQLLG